jgi:hypothetical protein
LWDVVRMKKVVYAERGGVGAKEVSNGVRSG